MLATAVTLPAASSATSSPDASARIARCEVSQNAAPPTVEWRSMPAVASSVRGAGAA